MVVLSDRATVSRKKKKKKVICAALHASTSTTTSTLHERMHDQMLLQMAKQPCMIQLCGTTGLNVHRGAARRPAGKRCR